MKYTKESYNYIDCGSYIRFIGNSHYYTDYPKYNFFRLLKIAPEVDDMYFDNTSYKQIIKKYLSLTTNENVGKVFYNIGLVYQLKAKNYNKMVEYYNLGINYGIYTGYANLYKHYIRKKNVTLAKYYLDKGVYHNCIVALADYSYLLFRELNYYLAEVMLVKGEEIDSNDLDIIFNYAIFYDNISNNAMKMEYIKKCKMLNHIEVNVLLSNDILNTLSIERIFLREHLKVTKHLRVKNGRAYFRASLAINYMVAIKSSL
jgi:hypothetical protein